MKNMLLVAAALTLLVPAAARAQDGTTATTPANDEKKAQTLSDQGYEAYQKGDYAKAVAMYLESYKLVPTAEILYNVASIYDKKLNDPNLAVEYYRRYNASPDAKGELIAKATARISTLSNPESKAPPSSTSTATTPRAEPPPPQESGSGLRTAGIVTGVVGLAAVGAGAITGVLASGKHSDSGCSDGVCRSEEARNDEKDAASLADVSTITFIAGGALILGGAAMYLLAPKRTTMEASRKAPSTGTWHLAPRADLHGAGMSVVGRF